MHKRLLTVFVACCLLTACGSLLKPLKTQPLQVYALSSVSHKRYGSKINRTLLVAKPTATPGYQTKNMIYVMRRYELRSFTRNRWAAPPADMLQPLLVQSLRHTGHFRAVVSVPHAGLTDFHLDVHLLMLEQQFSGRSSRVKMVLLATITDDSTHKVIASKTFSAVVNAPGDNPYSGVVAANQATQQTMQAIARFCVRVT